MNARQGTIKIKRLLDKKQIHIEYFDMDYMSEGVIHISNIPNAKYKLQVIVYEKLCELVSEYRGWKGLMVEFEFNT